uniref:Uncharacterized protein n=1 Tax=Chrysemys picta bellii TaxID=8478 RepID=A0A8C3FDX7_CHRPI
HWPAKPRVVSSIFEGAIWGFSWGLVLRCYYLFNTVAFQNRNALLRYSKRCPSVLCYGCWGVGIQSSRGPIIKIAASSF